VFAFIVRQMIPKMQFMIKEEQIDFHLRTALAEPAKQTGFFAMKKPHTYEKQSYVCGFHLWSANPARVISVGDHFVPRTGKTAAIFVLDFFGTCTGGVVEFFCIRV
jgi:hypothetical protein